jgi:hypothetical protein
MLNDILDWLNAASLFFGILLVIYVLFAELIERKKENEGD